jgi:hypothetical protein
VNWCSHAREEFVLPVSVVEYNYLHIKFSVLLPILVASGLLPTCWSMVGVILVIVYAGLWVVITSTERITPLRKKYTKY